MVALAKQVDLATPPGGSAAELGATSGTSQYFIAGSLMVNDITTGAGSITLTRALFNPQPAAAIELTNGDRLTVGTSSIRIQSDSQTFATILVGTGGDEITGAQASAHPFISNAEDGDLIVYALLDADDNAIPWAKTNLTNDTRTADQIILIQPNLEATILDSSQTGSLPSGITWRTLPGSTGEMQNNVNTLDDTVYGQPFQSQFPGIIDWQITTDAIWKGFAGYVATIFKVDAEDNDGLVKALDQYGDGLIELCGANSFTLTQNANSLDFTDMCQATKNSGRRLYKPGLRTVSLELSGFYNKGRNNITNLEQRQLLVVELRPKTQDNTNERDPGYPIARGFFRLTGQSQSGDVGALEEETLTFELNVPDNFTDATLTADRTPFQWFIPDADGSLTKFSASEVGAANLNPAIAIALEAWQEDHGGDIQLNDDASDIESTDHIFVRYLPDGIVTGAESFVGKAFVSDFSLSGGIESMNVFSLTLMGSGTLLQQNI